MHLERKTYLRLAGFLILSHLLVNVAAGAEMVVFHDDLETSAPARPPAGCSIILSRAKCTPRPSGRRAIGRVRRSSAGRPTAKSSRSSTPRRLDSLCERVRRVLRRTEQVVARHPVSVSAGLARFQPVQRHDGRAAGVYSRGRATRRLVRPAADNPRGRWRASPLSSEMGGSTTSRTASLAGRCPHRSQLVGSQPRHRRAEAEGRRNPSVDAGRGHPGRKEVLRPPFVRCRHEPTVRCSGT